MRVPQAEAGKQKMAHWPAHKTFQETAFWGAVEDSRQTAHWGTFKTGWESSCGNSGTCWEPHYDQTNPSLQGKHHGKPLVENSEKAEYYICWNCAELPRNTATVSVKLPGGKHHWVLCTLPSAAATRNEELSRVRSRSPLFCNVPPASSADRVSHQASWREECLQDLTPVSRSRAIKDGFVAERQNTENWHRGH